MFHTVMHSEQQAARFLLLQQTYEIQYFNRHNTKSPHGCSVCLPM